MRDIKFRAWHKRRLVMFDVQDIQICIGTIHGTSKDDEDSCLRGFAGKNIEIMQYTGLKDKNGTEIFEDDFVRLVDKDDYLYEVLGGDTVYRVTEIYFSWAIENKAGFSLFSDTTGKFEVIGNIHENPELLED